MSDRSVGKDDVDSIPETLRDVEKDAGSSQANPGPPPSTGELLQKTHSQLRDTLEDRDETVKYEDDHGNVVLEHPKLPGILYPDGRREMRAKDCWDKLGFSWPRWKKWGVILIISSIQISMNFNTSVYPNTLAMFPDEFGISSQKARVSQLLFMIPYAIGCELWAPLSEQFGRWPVMQASLTLVNVWQVLGGLAPNYASICVARALGGISSAGGSVTLGMVADMWESNRHGFALAFLVLASCIGTSIGPVFGGIMQDQLSWHWHFWIMLIFGGIVQAIHFCLCPETRTTVLMDREAKRRRKEGEDENIWGPTEIHPFDIKHLLVLMRRPYEMLLTEPIVTFLSLLSGFSDGLIFTFEESFSFVYPSNWGFGNTATGLAFLCINIAYFIGCGLHYIDVARQRHVINRYGDDSRHAERRMLLLLFLAPFEPIGLIGFAWTTWKPYKIPWIASMLFGACIAVANYSIYFASVDYMIASYGPYSASASGGNAFSRDLMAGIAAMYAQPLYLNIGTLHLQWASLILGCISIFIVIPVYIFYIFGPQIRGASKFAQALAANKDTVHVSDNDLDDETRARNDSISRIASHYYDDR